MPRDRNRFAHVMGWKETRDAQMEAEFPVPPSSIDWHGEFIRLAHLSATARVVGGTIGLFGWDDDSDECRLSVAEIASGSGLSVPTTRRALRDLLASGWIEKRPSRSDGQPVFLLSLPTFGPQIAAMLGKMDRRAALTIGTALTELTRKGPDNLPPDAVLTGALVAVGSAIASEHGPKGAAHALRDLAALFDDPNAWPELRADNEADDGFEAEASQAFIDGLAGRTGPSGG